MLSGGVLMLLCLAGCEPAPKVVPYSETSSVRGDEASDHFDKGFRLIEELTYYEADQAMAQAAYYLNRWLETQPKGRDWSSDPMIDESLGALRRVRTLQNLGRMQLTTNDVRYLQQSMWMRKISQWSLQSPMAPDLQAELDALPAELAAEERQALADAVRLFDWTIRNIQLDPPPQVSEEATSRGDASQPLAAQGIPGPGYSLLPWQVVLYGHGDAWLRARVYILLARQRGLDAVVLATGGEADEAPRPWAVGTLIGEQLYLFDPELGLPLPSAEGRGVATLAEVVAEPERLESLHVGQSLRYPVAHADLKHIVALIDASSEALSYRMQVVEGRLTGDRRMVLTISPTKLAERLRALPQVAEVRLWHIPLEAELYQLVWDEIRRTNSRAVTLHDRDRILFEGYRPLREARQLYFEHAFTATDDEEGALARYMDARVISDRDIDALMVSEEAQEKAGIVRQRGESDDAWQVRLANAQQFIRQGKQYASYWIGLVHYEVGNYEDARNWFERRTIESSPDSFWIHGARYNLGRAHEAMGNYEEARAVYLLDQSPQRHGNLLRARAIRLRHLGDEAGNEEDAASEASASEKPSDEAASEDATGVDTTNEDASNEDASREGTTSEETSSETENSADAAGAGEEAAADEAP